MEKIVKVILDGEDIVSINIKLQHIISMINEGIRFNNCSEDEVIQEINELQNMYFK